MSMPNVAVVMPVFNGESYLAEAIESILSQDYRSFELLILNDGSTDASDSIVNRYLGDERVRYVSRENRGLGDTLNELVALARGELIARMDADDVSLPGRLSAQVRLLASRPDIGMCGTDYQFLVDEHTTTSRGVITDPVKVRQALLQGRFPICHPTLMFRKSIFHTVGGYRVQGCGEDLDMFLRFSEAAQITNVDEVLFRYRLHDKSLAASRAHQLAVGYAYARKCAEMRASGQEEPDFGTYVRQLGSNAIRSSIYAKWFSVSEALNRKSIVSKAKRHKLRSTLFLAMTALLRPHSALSRARVFVLKRLSRKTQAFVASRVDGAK